MIRLSTRLQTAGSVVCLLAVLSPAPSRVSAQEAPAHPVISATLDETLAAARLSTSTSAANDSVALATLIDELLRTNQELKAASTRVVAATSRPDRAESLPDPSLALVYRNVGFPEFTLGDEMMTMLGVRVTQALPASGKRPQRRLVAEQDVEMAAAMVESTRRRLIQEVATAYYELAYVHEAIDIVGQTRELLLDLEETAETRYAVGDGLQQDVLKGQVEISTLLNRIVQLDQQRASLEARINRLVGRKTGAPLGRPEALDLELNDIPIAAVLPEATRSSAILAARAQRIEQQHAAVELVRTDRRPDLMLSGAYMNRGGLPGLWELNIGFTLPIRKSGNQDLEIEENLQELDARRSEHVDAIQAVELVVHDSYLRTDRAIRLTRLYRDAIVPQALLSLESMMAGYGVGKVDFPAVLDSVVTLLTYRIELAREAASYAKAVVRIEEHLGRSLGATPSESWQAPPLTTNTDVAGAVTAWAAGGER